MMVFVHGVVVRLVDGAEHAVGSDVTRAFVVRPGERATFGAAASATIPILGFPGRETCHVEVSSQGKAPGKQGPKPKSAASSHTPLAHAKGDTNHKKALRAMCFLIGYESVKTLLDEIRVEISA